MCDTQNSTLVSSLSTKSPSSTLAFPCAVQSGVHIDPRWETNYYPPCGLTVSKPLRYIVTLP